jgi:hypothetical protein
MGSCMAIDIGVNGTANLFLYTVVREICLQVKITGVESGTSTKYIRSGKGTKHLGLDVQKCPFIAWAL